MKFTADQVEIIKDFHNGLAANGVKLEWRSGEWALYMGKPYIYLGANKWLEILTGLEFHGAPSGNFLYLPMLYEDWLGLTQLVWGQEYMEAMADFAAKTDTENTPEDRLVKRIELFMDKAGIKQGNRTAGKNVKDSKDSELIIKE